MTDEMTRRLEWPDGELEWTVDRFTDAPDGRFLFFRRRRSAPAARRW